MFYYSPIHKLHTHTHTREDSGSSIRGVLVTFAPFWVSHAVAMQMKPTVCRGSAKVNGNEVGPVTVINPCPRPFARAQARHNNVVLHNHTHTDTAAGK